MPKPSAIVCCPWKPVQYLFPFSPKFTPSKVCTDACCWWSWMHCSHSERAPFFSIVDVFVLVWGWRSRVSVPIYTVGCLSGAVAYSDSESPGRSWSCHSRPFRCILPACIEVRSCPCAVATTPPEPKDYSASPLLLIGSLSPPQRLTMNLSAAYTQPFSLFHNIKCMC